MLLSLLLTARLPAAEPKPAAAGPAPQDSTVLAPVQEPYSDVYLDTVVIRKPRPINDYLMIGAQYGYSMCAVSWNPEKKQDSRFLPLNFGILLTGYGKMFNYMPYFGWQLGVFYTQDAYRLQQTTTGSTVVLDLKTKECEAVINNIEVPFMAHLHVDFWKMKIMANIGLYAGYRLSIRRSGPYVDPAYEQSFTDYNNRFDYGLKGGAGIGFVFDPVEIHLTTNVKFAWSSLYKPDYNSPYYYRFAYPYYVTLSLGIHYQLTRRQGRTNRELREEARRRVDEMYAE